MKKDKKINNTGLTNSNSYLEGTFTEFDKVHDSMSRIYKQEDYLPHLEHLSEKIKQENNNKPYKSKTQEQRIFEASIGHNVGPQGPQRDYNKELENAIKYIDYCTPEEYMSRPIDYSEYIKENQDMKKDKKVTAKELKDNSKKVERLVEDVRDNIFVTEVYTFTVTNEYDGEKLITDIPSQPLQTSANPKHSIKESWKIPTNKKEITMEVNLEHHSTDDSNILPEYKELISEMWKAKYRNEIICNEIGKKYSKIQKESKKKKNH